MTSFLNRFKLQIFVALAFAAGMGTATMLRPAPAEAGGFDLDDLLGTGIKVVGVKLLIDEFGDQIDDFINTFMDNNDARTDAESKVVTIVSPLGNKHIGAAQITGPRAAVRKVGAVAQLETSFMNKKFRIKALIPIEGSDPSNIKRVPGVGVSAVIDVKL
jgi:hypothetical protein